MYKNNFFGAIASLFFASMVFTSDANAAAFSITLTDLQANVGANESYTDPNATNGLCDRKTRNWDYDGANNRFRQEEIITDSGNGARSAMATFCVSSTRFFAWSNGTLRMVRRDFLDQSNNVVNSVKYNPGIVILRANMNPGDAYTEYVKIVSSANGIYFSTQTTTFAGTALTVNVPMGSYTGCYARDISNTGTSINKAIRCPGIGNLVLEEFSNTGASWARKVWVRSN